MSFNTFGKLFRFTTWGESHGPAIGCVVDGCPPNIALKERDIQIELNKRKPGQSKFTTQRKEDDKVQILSGVFEGKTTGAPISLIIYNKDMRSRDYETIKNKFRPGHADFTYYKKYGIRDYRGGGRQSARETASRVAAGAIAKKVLENKIGKKFKVIGAVTQLGILGCDLKKWNDQTIRKNPLFCPDKSIVKLWEKYLLNVRKSGSSCGAVIEVRARGIPVGLGAPIYSKLDMDIASAMMSINAVKGVNIGSGMRAAQLTGAAIIPAAAHCTKHWGFTNRDTFYIPKPFGRIEVVYGKPIYFTKDQTFDECLSIIKEAMDNLELLVDNRVLV